MQPSNEVERVRVAIVDDNTDLADVLAIRLELEGFESRAFHSAVELLAIRGSFKPQCVLLDIAMPGMDGLELAKELRDSNGDDLILLAMTGMDAGDMRIADTFNLVDHYFQKPVSTASILKILKRL